MTRVITYIKLMIEMWNKNKVVEPVYNGFENEEEILDFDLHPYLGWMAEELCPNNNT